MEGSLDDSGTHEDDPEEAANNAVTCTDKASFREQSASFQKLLDKSSKFRKKEQFTLPDPVTSCNSPRRLESLTQKSSGDADGTASPRRQSLRRNNRDSNLEPISEQPKPKVVELNGGDNAVVGRRIGERPALPPVMSTGLPIVLPVKGLDRSKMADIGTLSPKITARSLSTQSLSVTEGTRSPVRAVSPRNQPMRISLDDPAAFRTSRNTGKLDPLAK